jgi:hypothetical protein
MTSLVTMTVKDRGVRKLLDSVSGDVRKLKRELATAVRATAKNTKSQMAKAVAKELRATQKVIKSTLKDTVKPSATIPTAEITLRPSKRIPLRDFGARQGARGVSYRISKEGKRGFVDGAFQGPKPGAIKASWKGRVFKREGAKVKMSKGRYAGKMRQPLVQLFGPSPWGVFVKNDMKPEVNRDTQAYLIKQIERRIRAINGGWIRANNVRMTK